MRGYNKKNKLNSLFINEAASRNLHFYNYKLIMCKQSVRLYILLINNSILHSKFTDVVRKH